MPATLVLMRQRHSDCYRCLAFVARHLSEAQKRAFTILDNRLAEDATWDFQLLAQEIELLKNEGIELQATGFEIPEVEMIFDAVARSASNPADDTLPNLTPDRVTIKPGDLWIIGDHRLFCGDARRRECFATLLSKSPLMSFSLIHPIT